MTTVGTFAIICMLWLQSFPGIAESAGRLKRELKFPKGGSFAAAVALASFLPKGPTDGLAHVLEFDLGFPFPEKFVYSEKKAQKKTWQHSYKRTKNWYQQKRPKRSLNDKERMNLLLKMENIINRVGFNGLACASRFQCELKKISGNTLLEELLLVLFRTSNEPSDSKCEEQYKKCPVSLLQVIMHSEQISPPQML